VERKGVSKPYCSAFGICAKGVYKKFEKKFTFSHIAAASYEKNDIFANQEKYNSKS